MHQIGGVSDLIKLQEIIYKSRCLFPEVQAWHISSEKLFYNIKNKIPSCY